MTHRQKISDHARAPLVVFIGTIAISLGWLFTPRYGPWLCHAALGSICLAVIFYYGTIDLTSGWTMRAGISGATLGLILAIVSWLGAPFAARLVPSFGTELEQLYGTLHRAPGPLKALPILVATVTAEELVWRGELIAWLQQRVTTVQTIAIATLSYATPVTMSRSPLLIVVAVCLGLALALQRIMLRSWQGPLIAHLVWALLVFVVKPLG